MTEWPPVDPADATAVAQQRDELVAAVRDHAGQVACQLARLEGGDYGQADIETGRGEWTVKYEGGDLEYLRFSPSRGSDTYVISTKQPPEPEPLAAALADYDAFVEGFNDYVASLDGVLDDVSTAFPAIATTDGVVAERDRVLGRVREICDRSRGNSSVEGGDYGTFTSRIGGTRWELKWDTDGASYLRVGGSNGLDLVSQYEPPSAADIREYAPQFADFVDAYLDHVDELELGPRTVELWPSRWGDALRHRRPGERVRPRLRLRAPVSRARRQQSNYCRIPPNSMSAVFSGGLTQAGGMSSTETVDSSAVSSGTISDYVEAMGPSWIAGAIAAGPATIASLVTAGGAFGDRSVGRRPLRRGGGAGADLAMRWDC